VIARARVPHLSRSLRMMNTTSDRAHDDDAAVHAAAASAVVDNNIRKFLLVCPQTLEAFRCVFFLFMCTINLCSPCHMPHTRTPVHQVARRAHHTSAHNETKRLHKDSFPFGSCIGATLTRSLFAQLPAPTPIARKHTRGAQTPRDRVGRVCRGRNTAVSTNPTSHAHVHELVALQCSALLTWPRQPYTPVSPRDNHALRVFPQVRWVAKCVAAVCCGARKGR
jgi:hypothetical protein